METKSLIVRHIIIWLFFIGYEIAYLHFSVGHLASFFHFTIYYVLNICLFYFNAHILLAFAFFRTTKPYLVSFILVPVEVMVYLFIKYFLDYVLAVHKPTLAEQLPFVKQYLMVNIWRGLYFIVLSIAYWSMLYMIRFKDKNHRMETEQLKNHALTLELENKYISAENAYLQNQISPHLLFNTLNFIYKTVYRLSEKAGNGVMLLSDLMRYSLVSSEDQNTVLLSSELEQINNLIGLSRLRFGEDLFITFQKKGKLRHVRIIPLLLITLVENMIKHADLGEPAFPGSIKLNYADGFLLFETVNKKRRSTPYVKSGYGLKNLEKRLINSYGDRFKFDIRDEELVYAVNLSIKL